jgi:hypothetical protein
MTARVMAMTRLVREGVAGVGDEVVVTIPS